MSELSRQFGARALRQFAKEFYVKEGNSHGGQRALVGALFGIYRADPTDTEFLDEAISIIRILAVDRGLKPSLVAKSIRWFRAQIAENDSDGRE